MRTIRGFIFYLLLAVTVIPVAAGCILFWPFVSNKKRYDWFGKPWATLMIWLLKVICGIRYRIIGLENIPTPNMPVVVLSKHQSAWETMFLPAMLPQRMGFVYKESLHWIPFFGWALKSMGMIGIDRNSGRSAYALFLQKGRKFMAKGWWVALFPEGTRVAPGVRGRYKSGGARFAVAVGAKVLPVALNSGHCWPRNSIAKYPGTVTVSFGPTLDASQMTFNEVNVRVETWIEGELARIEGMAPQTKIECAKK